MRVKYIGQPGDPDFVTAFGISFERKGKAIEVPDDHPKAQKFVNNPFFQVMGTPPDGLALPQAPEQGAFDVIEPPEAPATA